MAHPLVKPNFNISQLGMAAENSAQNPVDKDTPLNKSNHIEEVISNTMKQPEQPKIPTQISEKAFQVLMLVYGFVAAVLLFRFALEFVGANHGAMFVNFVFQATDPLMIPFANIFGRPLKVIGFNFSLEILVAVLVYGLAFSGVAKLTKIILKK